MAPIARNPSELRKHEHFIGDFSRLVRWEKSRLLLLFLTLFFVMLGFGIIIPNLAYYAEDIGATPTEIAILMSIYSGMQIDICADMG